MAGERRCAGDSESSTGCLIHNLEAARRSRARGSRIHYSCFLLSPTSPAMEITDPLLDEDEQLFELILLTDVILLVMLKSSWA